MLVKAEVEKLELPSTLWVSSPKEKFKYSKTKERENHGYTAANTPSVQGLSMTKTKLKMFNSRLEDSTVLWSAVVKWREGESQGSSLPPGMCTHFAYHQWIIPIRGNGVTVQTYRRVCLCGRANKLSPMRPHRATFILLVHLPWWTQATASMVN